MSITTKHPQYIEFLPFWEFLRTSYKGQSEIKRKKEAYLPPTAGMIEDGFEGNNDKAPGKVRYAHYLLRAVYPEYVKKAVEQYVGVMFQEPPEFTLPPQMEYLRERASSENESLEDLLRRINSEQLITGRFGLLLDINTNSELYISLYATEKIFNWDEDQFSQNQYALNLVVLDESGNVRSDDNVFTWTYKNQYRVLSLGPASTNEDDDSGYFYQFGVFDEEQSSFSQEQMTTQLLAGEPLEEIPFVFGNTKDIIADPDTPPLLYLANLCIAVYRADADYRQNLHQQGQDTLVVIGGITDNKDERSGGIRVGTGATIETDLNGDAKFIGTDSNGLVEQRRSLENDKSAAEVEAGQAIKPGMQVESGESVRRRLASQTATLNQIAITGAQALERTLKLAARWLGLDEDSVAVKPNTEFDLSNLSSQELLQLTQAWREGLPISLESFHDYLMERNVTEVDFATEMQRILSEPEQLRNILIARGNEGNAGDGTGEQNTNGGDSE